MAKTRDIRKITASGASKKVVRVKRPRSAAASRGEKTWGAVTSELNLSPVKIRKALGLSQPEMATLIGMSSRKISSLETCEKKPTQDDLRRFNELDRLKNELSRVMATEAVPTWIKAPNNYFGGMSPVEVIQRGQSDRIFRLVWQLQDGIPLD
jgi:transcriptional regulator with XRE-family HTH domain